ncbi:MAG: thiamine phosphate synthase [Deltaproteobacteria bacterium]|nr:thiamine phosphate synthase [Kofleriaceae bacterium]
MRQSTAPGDTSLSAKAKAARIRGFYAILDRDDEQLAKLLVTPAADAGAGARVLQVRLKPASTREILAAARMARRVTREAGALLVVNDRLDVALACDADGVHLGQDDLPRADYLGFGPVFATSTKANPDPVVGLAGLSSAVQLAAPIPVVAIGGIALEHAPSIAATGAAAACAISAINSAPDPAAAARALSLPFA